KHLNYVEPFAGSLEVLFRRDPDDPRFWWGDSPGFLTGVSEVVNDINGHLTNFYQVLQGEDTFDRFLRMASVTPFSEPEYGRPVEMCERAGDGDPVLWAWAYFVHVRQSHAAMMKGFAGVTKTRTRSRRNEQASAWLGAVEGLPAAHARLRNVLVLN